jgi:hypothetical protein
MSHRATGLRQASYGQRDAARLYRGISDPSLAARVGAVVYPIQQPIARIIDQGSLGACVGCAMCACSEAVLGVPPYRSWVRLWTDARRRHGSIQGDDEGTWFAYAIQSAMRRGFDVEEPGEWDNPVERTEPDDLDSELAAYDTRQQETEHWRVPDGDLDAIDDALSRGLGVGIGTGVRNPYFSFFSSARSPSLSDVVLGTDALGGSSNGHEQRIVSVQRVNGIRRYCIQNSWGLNGGCHLPNGTFRLGCCWVTEDVVKSAWDCDVIRISKRVG